MDTANGMAGIGKALMIMGAVIFVLGAVLALTGKAPLIGRLPGDILIERKNLTFYFPIATGILISVVLTLLLWLLSKR